MLKVLLSVFFLSLFPLSILAQQPPPPDNQDSSKNTQSSGSRGCSLILPKLVMERVSPQEENHPMFRFRALSSDPYPVMISIYEANGTKILWNQNLTTSSDWQRIETTNLPLQPETVYALAVIVPCGNSPRLSQGENLRVLFKEY